MEAKDKFENISTPVNNTGLEIIFHDLASESRKFNGTSEVAQSLADIKVEDLTAIIPKQYKESP